MQVRPDQLPDQLSRQLAPVYFIYGDEPLQREEAADAIRARVRSSGEFTREVLHVDRDFNWDRLSGAADNLSLFAEQRLVELRLDEGKVGRLGSRALVDYTAQLPPDQVLLIISSGRLDAGTRKSRWVRALAGAGVEVPVWPVDAARMPQWIQTRMRALGMQPTAEAAALLAQRVEGNLLAARQEIEKLLLLMGPNPVNAGEVEAAVGDSARFDIFGLVDAALAGEVGRTVRIVERLRIEGVEPVLVLWALGRELPLLTNLARACQQGQPLAKLLSQARVIPRRQALLQAAAQRHTLAVWLQFVCQCARLDRVIKGVAGGDPWQEILALSVALAGVAPPAVLEC